MISINAPQVLKTNKPQGLTELSQKSLPRAYFPNFEILLNDQVRHTRAYFLDFKILLNDQVRHTLYNLI